MSLRERTRSDCKSSWRKSHVPSARMEAAPRKRTPSITRSYDGIDHQQNYSEAERRLHYVDHLMLDLIEEMGATAVRSGLWT
jgi:hypothetical protein